MKLLSRLAKAIYASPEIKVYEKVINHAEVCASTAKALREAIDAAIKGDMPRDLIERVYALEKQADVLRRQILDDLAKGGLPPLTREDFVRLAERVDKVADWSKEAARLIKASQGLSLDDELKALVRSLAEAEVKAANLLHRALTEMQSSYDSALSIIKEIEKLEDEADEDYVKALALTAKLPCPKMVLVERLIDAIENAIDACEDASDVLEEIIVRAIR